MSDVKANLTIVLMTAVIANLFRLVAFLRVI
jgi:hypothetical protein